MKKMFLNFLVILFTQFLFSQETQTASVEKSIFGIQTGFLGVWVHNETRLSDAFSLRSEVGLDAGILGGEVHNGNGVILVPVIRSEPRWYYNLDKRIAKGKNIEKNSGNFVALNIAHNPDWLTISNKDTIDIISSVAIIPKWGIKRSINHFTFETGIGLGYVVYLEDFVNKSGDTALDLHLRIGYTF